jgi:hypothetical protein
MTLELDGKLTPHTVQVVDFDDIMDVLFTDDVESINEVVGYLMESGWTFGDTPYTLVASDAFFEFLYAWGPHIPALTTERIENLRGTIPAEVYINLEARR